MVSSLESGKLVGFGRLDKHLWLFLLLAFASVVVYLCAPDSYLFEYDCYCFVQYVVSMILFMRARKKKNFFDFDTIFLIAFLCTFFLYPVFLYPVNPRYFAVFNYGFSEDVISKSTALALVGSQMYMLGSLWFQYRPKKPVEQNYRVEFLPDKIVILLTILFFVLFLLLGGLTYYRSLYSGDASAQFQSNAAFSYANTLFQVSLATSIMLEFNKQLFYNRAAPSPGKLNKTFLMFVCMYIPFLLSTGSRGTTMETLLMLMGLYTLYFKPIKFKWFMLLVLLGALGMTFIAVVRGKGSFEVTGFIDIFMDLIINNRNTFVAVDYVDENGMSFGVSMLGYILKVVPFAQNLVLTILGIEPYMANSALFLTVQTLGHDPTFGLGTNIIADLYLAFGFGGVVLFMWAGGYLMAKVQYMALHYHVYYMLMYTVFMSFSVYVVRSEFFFSLNALAWSACILNVLRHFCKKKKEVAPSEG